jgi:hypothetical protein
VPGLRPSSNRDDADGCVPIFLCLQGVRIFDEAEEGRLLRFLLVRRGVLPADARGCGMLRRLYYTAGMNVETGDFVATKEQIQEAAMSQKRVLVVDGYNVIKLLRELDVSFEEIASLGCYIEDEAGKKLRPELIAVWFNEENEERERKARVAE